jgi:hypothetical protein
MIRTSRRVFLASAGSVLTTGCLSRVGAIVDTRVLHTINLTVESRPPSPLDTDAALIKDRITTAETAQLRVVYTNSGQPNVEVGTVPEEHHYSRSQIQPENSGPSLLLLPAEVSGEYTRIASDCWFPKEEVGFITLGGTDLSPGESLELQYKVWAGQRNTDPCIPSGDYQFVIPPPSPESLRFTPSVTTDQ